MGIERRLRRAKARREGLGTWRKSPKRPEEPKATWVLRGPRPEEKPRPYCEEELLREGTLLSHEAAEGLPWVLWDGDYEKEFYWVKPPGGGLAVKCWPNAGWMNTVDGSGRMWQSEANIMVAKVGDDA